ncbi:hypothetical protein XHV734_0779 [Xanthomonas hortorum pv. vitians]|nr:hypothetical protein XHV734_0779 [Xanthomonas hortorum pv. vitians]
MASRNVRVFMERPLACLGWPRRQRTRVDPGARSQLSKIGPAPDCRNKAPLRQRAMLSIANCLPYDQSSRTQSASVPTRARHAITAQVVALPPLPAVVPTLNSSLASPPQALPQLRLT